MTRDEAETKARALGHDLSPWHVVGRDDGAAHLALCRRLDCSMRLLELPTGIVIERGPAVSCPCRA